MPEGCQAKTSVSYFDEYFIPVHQEKYSEEYGGIGKSNQDRIPTEVREAVEQRFRNRSEYDHFPHAIGSNGVQTVYFQLIHSFVPPPYINEIIGQSDEQEAYSPGEKRHAR